MSFLLKKVTKPWNATNKGTQPLNAKDQPRNPPTPDLSHLTPDEISVINDVIRRQEEFDRLEAGRVRKIKEELDHIQDQLVQDTPIINQKRKDIDLLLCRLCLKNKFPDGVGRVCYDCKQRVCTQCGSFTKPRWNYRRNKSMCCRWRCRLCSARREALCKTGGWYHAEWNSLDTPEDLNTRQGSPKDGDTDAGSSMGQEYETTNVEDSDQPPSGNRSDSILHQPSTRPLSHRRASASKYTRRKSLPPDSANRGEDGRQNRKCRGLNDKIQDGCLDGDDDDEDDDDDCFDSLVLHRKMSRRRRQEKKQRRHWKTGQDSSCENDTQNHNSVRNSTNTRLSGDYMRDYPIAYRTSGQGSPFDQVTRDRCVPSSSSLGIRQPSPIPSEANTGNTRSSTPENSSILSSFDDSSDGGGISSTSHIHSALSLTIPACPSKITRQDAISLGSSCISLSSACDGTGSRKGDASPFALVSSHERLGRDSSSPYSMMAKDVKVSQPANGVTSSANVGESSVAKWKKRGYKNAYVISIHMQSTDHSYSIGVMGGTLGSSTSSRALIQWVSSELRSRLGQGHEILEWNEQNLKDKTFDQVTSVTSNCYSSVILVINPLEWTDSGQMTSEDATASLLDRPSSGSPSIEGHGKGNKRRMLPRTPVEIKRGIRHVHGEISIQLRYHVTAACLQVTIRQAKGMVNQSSDVVEPFPPNPFVLVSIIPRCRPRESIETEIRSSTNEPVWEQVLSIENVSLSELTRKSLELSVWSYEERGDTFLGEVLIDLNEADLNNKTIWYQFQEHDENNSPLPQRRRKMSPSMSESLTSGSFHLISPAVSPEVPFHRQHSQSPSIVSSTVSPVSFRASRIGSKEFHLNSVSQPDSFTTKVRKKMRDTVNKMSSLSLSERKDLTGSDESPQMDSRRRSVIMVERRSPNWGNRKQISKEYQSMDLLAPPKPPSRTNSSSSFFWSEDEDNRSKYSESPSIPDRPPPEGDDITSILGPGQIPPKPSAEAAVFGDIKLGFMVSKGQLEVDIICAADLQRTGHFQPPDTYVKTYLVEGKKVIQRKKIVTVKSSYDPVYRKKIKYSACNVYGRIMKVDIWERTGSFEKKVCRGEVLVRLDHLDLSTHTMGWYKLFQINATDYGSDEYLNHW